MKFSRGFITGSLLGTVAGMIVLPYMNEKTRRKISNATSTVIDKTTGLISEARNRQ